ncbi:MAG: serine/threonine-protein kinase [Victivallaceae bacterium]|nr:serine/threonine-protein kinase [Victivallaceae bacterium]
MRFQCSFCSSIVSTDLPPKTRLECASCGHSCFVPATPFEENCVIGDFVIGEEIGAGSIGKVYHAVQLSLGREVALKILSPELSSSKFIDSFLHEARAAAQLSHTNLVQAYAVGEENGVCYLAMSYIKGETLSDRLEREKRIPVDEALHIAQQVAEALFYAWDDSRLIHRDVKPDNIMITTDGIVKLTDMGLAITQEDWNADAEISGSPSYMSPEQFAGEELDCRSDIYSLGITLYQMISGKLPFVGESFQEIASQHFNEEPVPLYRFNVGATLKVSNLVKKMMEKLPEDRFQNYDVLLKSLWNLRHVTAPDSSLIPDIHTVSIHHLDYGLQKKSYKNIVSTQKKVKQLKNRRDILFWTLVTIFPVPIVVLLVFLLVMESAREPDITGVYETKMQVLALRCGSSEFLLPKLKEQAGKLLADLKEIKQPTLRQELLLWQVRYYIKHIENQQLKNELRDQRIMLENNNKKIFNKKQN